MPVVPAAPARPAALSAVLAGSAVPAMQASSGIPVNSLDVRDRVRALALVLGSRVLGGFTVTLVLGFKVQV